MEKRELKSWEKNIKVLFEKTSQLTNLIANPIYYSDAPWAKDVSNYFIKSIGSSVDKDVFYRIVFKKGSATSLMTLGSGELSGLQTTSVIEKGRITNVAGLEPVKSAAAPNLLAMLLKIGMFGAIQNHLSYISNICVDIRNRQIVGDHAKLERISEVILDCFESIPEMNQEMMHLNLARIMNNTDECLELLIVMREELSRDSNSRKTSRITTNWQREEILTPNGERLSYSPIDFVREMMQHNVFAAYERFVAGKICQIILSGNYSLSNIERSKQSVIRIQDSIRKIFSPRIQAHHNGVTDFNQRLSDLEYNFKNGNTLQNQNPDYNYAHLKTNIEKQLKTISEIEAQLHNLLDAKLESFDFLIQLANKDKIDVYLINGAIIINEQSVNVPQNQNNTSSIEITQNVV